MTNENAQVSLNTVSTVDNKRIPFGTRLKSTREAMGLERKDVASQLRLNEKIIVMMEKDRYPVDLPVTFIRGYLRSYAKFLQIPEFEIKKGIEPIKQKSMNIDPLTPIKQQPDTITSGDYFMQFSTYLIIFTLFALVAMWWYTHSTQKSAATTIATTEAANPKPAVTETVDNTNTAPAETANTTDENEDKLSVNNDQLPSTDEEMAASASKPTEPEATAPEAEATAPNSAQEVKPTEARSTDKKPADQAAPVNTAENTNTATEAKPKAKPEHKPEQTAAAANTATEPTKLKPAQTTAAATKPTTTPMTTTPSSAVGEVIAGLEDTGDIATQIDQSSGEPVKHTVQRQKHN